VEQINQFVVPVETSFSSKTIESNRNHLIRKLEEIVANNIDLPKSLSILDIVDQHTGIKRALDAKKQIIIKEAEKAGKRIIARNSSLKYLQDIKFFQLKERVHLLVETYSDTEANKSYQAAANAGRTLYEELMKAETTFLNSELPKDLSRVDFKKNCLLAVKKGLIDLSKYPDWKITIGKIANSFEPTPKTSTNPRVANQNGTFFMKTGVDLPKKKPIHDLAPLNIASVTAA
jgi:hypothetical protein